MIDRSAWAEPGVETLHPGVHRIPLPLPSDALRAVNVYVLEDLAEDDGLLLVDSGWATPEARRALEEGLAAIGRDLTEIRDILVTHVHRDHYTHAVELRRSLGCRVHLGAGERRGLELLNERRGGLSFLLRTLCQAGATALAEEVRPLYPDDYDPRDWAAPDHWLGEETLRFPGGGLRVVPTPGHTRGHVVYLDERRGLMFSGDHVLPHITPSVGFEPADPGGRPLADFLDSLHLMTRYADARLLPAHGPVTDSVHARVTELLAHHEDRLRATLTALGDGANDAFGVARGLTWTRREVPFGDLDAVNRMLAVNETVAHLDVLVLRGRTTVETADGTHRYARVR
ncbi:MBL fold metallo-hydrolase [Nocardiopsis sp. EMB25]|uniref:MBL fold metallo-hydrolase n=1 Tax=Nocardiopsis sp. EMB25 TaxID=2835867 RepID=UPI0022836EB0|nr:MBL fold metallo-hydrolase [Nocardiopsis sp. EMB25]MCY9784373.1 MBL fold metallo-hydrolase [Nocardiopsis sp. EMB25]